MEKFFMEYNPYTKEYVFQKNGNPLKNKMEKAKNKHLQEILDPSSNWKGLDKEIQNQCNAKEIEVTFRGRRIDFDDLEYCLKASKAAHFTLKLEETSNEEDVIGRLDKIFDDIKNCGISEFQGNGKNGESIFEKYENVKKNIFDIDVIATMSSGKSTLINAILGTELLPAKNEACTATVARILDNDELAGDGFDAICYAEDERTVIYPKKKVKAEDLQKYNEDVKVTFIDMEGDIEGVSSEKIRLQICDTPGPNNSRNENHGRLTHSIITNENAIVLYVMNATNFAVNDDKALLTSISEEMKRKGKESRDRFIFVVNKCDALDEEQGETVEKLLNNVREYLKKFNIEDPVLIPTSARLALLIRKSRNGEQLTRKESNDLQSVDDFVAYEFLHYEKYASLTPSVRRSLEAKAAEYHKDKDNWDLEAVIHTGVGALEAVLSEYLDKYAYPMKIYDAIKDIKRILDDIDMKTKFKEKIAADEKEWKDVRKQIETAKAQQNQSRYLIDEYGKEIDSFELDLSMEDKWKRDIQIEMGKFLEDYNDKQKVDKADAERKINAFLEKVKIYEKECANGLSNFLESEVYGKGQEMLDDYKKKVDSIFDGMEIAYYDFKKDMSFSRVVLDNLDDIIESNESDRTHTETRWKDNPEKKGIRGFLQFWKPKRISYTETVKDGVDVDIVAVIATIINGYKDALNKNVEVMFDEARKKLSEYKRNFKENLDKLCKKLEDVLDKMDQDTADFERLQKVVNEEKEKAAFADEKISELMGVIDFKA